MITEKNKKTEIEFWDNYWQELKLPSVLNENFPFERSLKNELLKIINSDNQIGNSVLEIGCSPGKYLNLFYENGFEIAGIEYSPIGAEAMKKNFESLGIDSYRLIEGDFFNIEPEPIYDIVMSFGFIEHFEDVTSVIKLHSKWLKPRGKLILGIPNFKGFHGFAQKYISEEVLFLHNTSIMNRNFFNSLEASLNCRILDFRYACSLEPDMTLGGKKTTFMVFVIKACFKLIRLFRRLSFTDNYNGKHFSSYILVTISDFEKDL